MDKLKKIGIGIGIIGVIIMTVLVGNGSVSGFDATFDGAVTGMRSVGFNTLVEMFTYVGNWQTVVIVCLLLIAYDSTSKSYGIPVTAVALVSSISNRILKDIMQIPRPDAANMLIEQGGYSFPSGHTATFTAVMLMLIVLLIKNKPEKFGQKGKAWILGIILVLLTVLMGLSRVYLGVHHTSDIIGGWFIGLASFSIVLVGLDYYKKKHEN